MAARRVVVALGGNAFAAPRHPLTMAGQFAFARQSLAQLGPLLDRSTQLVITHGNGPQVGQELVRVEAALGQAYALPLDVCVAETEGELGYVLERSLYEVLAARGESRLIATLLTQVLVDPRDEAFAHPTKPVGVHYSAAQAAELRARGFVVREEAGRGFRRVVPSPRPIELIEAEVVARLLDLGIIVITAGGGGIPVVRRADRLEGVGAVVDKDLTSALLADRLAADCLVILTDVAQAYLDFSTAARRPIGATTPDELRGWLEAGHFPAGSMGPKIEAAIQFVDRPSRLAIICNTATLAAAWRGAAGTRVALRGFEWSASVEAREEPVP